ncbi:8806_t:CDS:2 [Diversispora eburnea]|uniref:8806_t:CDS:1 n=1 Tax=Diversispora eburnea TaxID=1213867 RepID=A0A9N9BY05_9GLOM|nr:8806_t:CDS:2 [Diversispora eburnea]
MIIINTSIATEVADRVEIKIESVASASYFQCRKWEHALKDAEQVIKIRPDWPKGYFRKGETLIKLGRISEALDNYYIVQQKNPKISQIPLRIAKALVLKENEYMGLTIHTLVPGQDICISRKKSIKINPIQNKIFEFAVEMKNLIYVIVDNQSKKCVVIDAFIKNKQLELVGAIVTHYHFDHVGGIPPPPYDNLSIKISGLFNLLKRCPKVKAYIHPNDIPFVLKGNPGMIESMPIDTSDYYLNNYCLNNNDNVINYNIINYNINNDYSDKSDNSDDEDNNINININNSSSHLLNLLSLPHLSSHLPSHLSSHLQSHLQSSFLHMPGHTQGSQSILINESRLFTGDTLMCGCVGRLDLPGGNLKEMKITLKDRLGDLNDNIVIYPGHNYGGDWTTIGIEREKGIIGNIKRR